MRTPSRTIRIIAALFMAAGLFSVAFAPAASARDSNCTTGNLDLYVQGSNVVYDNHSASYKVANRTFSAVGVSPWTIQGGEIIMTVSGTPGTTARSHNYFHPGDISFKFNADETGVEEIRITTNYPGCNDGKPPTTTSTTAAPTTTTAKPAPKPTTTTVKPAPKPTTTTVKRTTTTTAKAIVVASPTTQPPTTVAPATVPTSAPVPTTVATTAPVTRTPVAHPKPATGPARPNFGGGAILALALMFGGGLAALVILLIQRRRPSSAHA